MLDNSHLTFETCRHAMCEQVFQHSGGYAPVYILLTAVKQFPAVTGVRCGILDLSSLVLLNIVCLANKTSEG